MAARRFKLTLWVHADRLFYELAYDPPVKNLGGSIGIVYENGGLHGMSFGALRALGNGTHVVELDETIHDPRGDEPADSDDAALIERVALAVFMQRVDAENESVVLVRIAMGFNERTAQQIDTMLSPDERASLSRFAAQIPRFRWRRRYYGLLSSAGATKVPDENLVTLKKFYRDAAKHRASGAG